MDLRKKIFITSRRENWWNYKTRTSGARKGKRIIHPQAITENMTNQFLACFWEDRMSMQNIMRINQRK